jgi:nucleoside permease NupC
MKETNVIEAASNGAAVAVMLVLNIGAQLIAFLALVAMFDAWLGFVGISIGEELSFKIVCGWLFYPFAYLMGVDIKDCTAVAELLGTKLFVNEFVAYEELSVMIDAGTLTDRSQVIATYALCGFANFGSIGIQLGGLGALAPNKVPRLAKLVFSAMIAGNIACFMTASIAGMLYDVERTTVG